MTLKITFYTQEELRPYLFDGVLWGSNVRRSGPRLDGVCWDRSS